MTKLEKYNQNKQELAAMVLRGERVEWMNDLLAGQKYKLIQRGVLAVDADPEIEVDFAVCARLYGKLAA